MALPAPSQLAITDGTARATGTLAATEVKLFSAVLGGGDASVRDAMSGQAAGSLTVLLADQLAGYDDEVPGSAGGPRSDAEVALPQAAPGAQPVVVVDAVYNAGSAPEPFTLTITQAAAGP